MNKAGIFLIVFLFPAAIYCAPAQGYYRFPDIHGGRIVFTAQGDLWTVGTNGGHASRLTSDPGTEFNAKISPDGKTVAFSAQYEGPTEVYTMPLDGGIPVRLTYEGGEALVRGWTPDGKIIYSTYHFSTYPSWQLVLIDPKTSFSEIVPLAQASDGVYEKSAGGEGTLYFTRLNSQSSHTKRYEGGTAQNIWRWEKGMEEAVPLTGDYAGTSKNPMIWMGRIYFASDRDGTMNIWSMAVDGTDKRQETFHRGFDISSPSLDGGKIVYHEGADIYLYDIASKSDRVVPIELSSDFDQEVRQWVKTPMDYLTSAHISQDGAKIVLTARGQVFAAPARHGRLVEVTRKSGVRYYNGAFMPDGKSILLQSDESGEIEYWKYPADGTGSGEKLTSLGKGYRYGGVISPDGRYFAFTDRGGRLFIRDSESGAVNQAASSNNGEFSDLAWSPDSRWLAYAGPADNFFMRIWLYQVKDKTNYMLTGDRVESYNPVWSRDGKWLYFLSDRTFNSEVDSPWGQNQPEPYFDKTTGIYALSLTGNESFPFTPPDELHNPPEAVNTNIPPVKIDLNGIGSRLFQVPVPAGNYSRLAANEEFLFFTERTEKTGLSNKLDAVEITNICPQVAKIEDNVKNFELSGNGKKLMVGKGDGFFIIDAAGSPSEDIDKNAVDLTDWSYSFNPAEEWRQMFIDAWRLERDYFYDPGLHGADYESVLNRYLPLVGRIRDRDELNDLLGQIVGELSALHTFVFGGDLGKPAVEIDVGSLGAFITRNEKGGGYRIDHIFRTDPDYPGLSSP
ncbi:MAG: protease, partial [Brevinematales bacterium]